MRDGAIIDGGSSVPPFFFDRFGNVITESGRRVDLRENMHRLMHVSSTAGQASAWSYATGKKNPAQGRVLIIDKT